MTYRTRPLYGIKESFIGPAGYAQAQFNQRAKPQPAQNMSVGNSKTEDTIEGFEKTIRRPVGTKQELMGAAAIAEAQAFQTWVDTNKK